MVFTVIFSFFFLFSFPLDGINWRTNGNRHCICGVKLDRKYVYAPVHCCLCVRSYKLDDYVGVPDRRTANRICTYEICSSEKELIMSVGL